MNLDFKKYKRVFAFGCSFTSYHWPSWASIVASECTNAIFYNFGRSGAGNLAISCKITEAHNKFNFNEDDLVMVLWSSYTREDRWVDGRWLCAGNVYANGLYDEKFCKEYADPLGYLIRDMALIYNTHTLLDTLPCSTLKLFSYPVKQQLDEGMPVKDNNFYKKFMAVYEPFINKTIVNTMWEYFKHNTYWPSIGHKFQHKYETEPSYDPHPNTMSYYKWLKHIGIPLTEVSKLYVDDCTEKLSRCLTYLDMETIFKSQMDQIDDSFILLL